MTASLPHPPGADRATPRFTGQRSPPGRPSRPRVGRKRRTILLTQVSQRAYRDGRGVPIRGVGRAVGTAQGRTPAWSPGRRTRGGRHRLTRCRRDPATGPTRTAPSPREAQQGTSSMVDPDQRRHARSDAPDRLRGLLAAQQLLTGDSCRTSTLQRTVDSACELVGAGHGAVAVRGLDGVLEQFVAHGMDADTARRLEADFPAATALPHAIVVPLRDGRSAVGRPLPRRPHGRRVHPRRRGAGRLAGHLRRRGPAQRPALRRGAAQQRAGCRRRARSPAALLSNADVDCCSRSSPARWRRRGPRRRPWSCPPTTAASPSSRPRAWPPTPTAATCSTRPARRSAGRSSTARASSCPT